LAEQLGPRGLAEYAGGDAVAAALADRFPCNGQPRPLAPAISQLPAPHFR
jgi:hypothetical protein